MAAAAPPGPASRWCWPARYPTGRRPSPCEQAGGGFGRCFHRSQTRKLGKLQPSPHTVLLLTSRCPERRASQPERGCLPCPYREKTPACLPCCSMGYGAMWVAAVQTKSPCSALHTISASEQPPQPGLLPKLIQRCLCSPAAPDISPITDTLLCGRLTACLASAGVHPFVRSLPAARGRLTTSSRVLADRRAARTCVQHTAEPAAAARRHPPAPSSLPHPALQALPFSHMPKMARPAPFILLASAAGLAVLMLVGLAHMSAPPAPHGCATAWRSWLDRRHQHAHVQQTLAESHQALPDGLAPQSAAALAGLAADAMGNVGWRAGVQFAAFDGASQLSNVLKDSWAHTGSFLLIVPGSGPPKRCGAVRWCSMWAAG